MYWETIKRGCSTGYDWFDFGRSTWEGPTFQFKKQWVPEPTQLVWQYALLQASEIPMLNPNNKKYEMLISLWRRLPLRLANRLGPHVIKNFP